MTDTTPKIYNKLIMLVRQKTPLERLKMCADMFDMARSLILASLGDGANQRRELFLRFYGQDFNAAKKEKILAKLAAYQFK